MEVRGNLDRFSWRENASKRCLKIKGFFVPISRGVIWLQTLFHGWLMSQWLAVRFEHEILSWNSKPLDSCWSSKSRRSSSPKLIWLLAVRILATRMESLIFQFTSKLIRIFDFHCSHLTPPKFWSDGKTISKFPKHDSTKQTPVNC